MINVALVGTWHVHFDGYARDIAKKENCKITCVWSESAEEGMAAAEKYSCKYVADYDALLARKDVDAVQVCTSTKLHKEIMIKAANAGKHIFTEKVLCFTEKDALEVADAVKKNNVKFCISFPWRSRGDFNWIKQAVDSKLIGDVSYFRMRNAHSGASNHWLPASFYDADACGGGAMMDLGAHSMYTLNWIMGVPVKASSAFTHVMVDSVEDNAVTLLTYENGAVGVSETGFVTDNNPFEIEVAGTKGTILCGGFMDKTCYNIGEGWVFPRIPEGLPSPMDMWVNAIENGGEISCGIDDAVALSRTMEMAYSNIF